VILRTIYSRPARLVQIPSRINADPNLVRAADHRVGMADCSLISPVSAGEGRSVRLGESLSRISPFRRLVHVDQMVVSFFWGTQPLVPVRRASSQHHFCRTQPCIPSKHPDMVRINLWRTDTVSSSLRAFQNRSSHWVDRSRSRHNDTKSGALHSCGRGPAGPLRSQQLFVIMLHT